MTDENTIDTDTTGSPGEPAETLRDDIASAFDVVETRDTPPGTAGAPPSGGEAPPAPPPGGGGRVRGPDGKFVASEAPPRPAEKAPAAPGAPQAAPTGKQPLATPPKPGDAPKPPDPAAAAAPQLRAPVSWKPGAREHWAKLPLDVQQEVARREVEINRTVQESAKAREALSHVQGVLGPYGQNIAASGRDALQAMEQLFKADNTLRHGSTNDKATLVANIVKSFGIDIAALDAILAGQQAPEDPNQALAERLRREMQQQLQPVMQHFNRMQGARQQALQRINTDAGTEVESFSTDGQHEFFDDVRADMADIIDLYTARGASISLQDAYDRAIRINPQVSEIFTKRAEAERVNAAAAAAQRARRTAASISGSPAPAGAGPGPAGDSRRAEIEAAWEQSGSG